jgi:hypothetical protein
MNISKYERKSRTEGLSIMSRGLLAYISRHLDSTGTYNKYDVVTAQSDGNNCTKATIQRHRQELIDGGYLWHKPRFWVRGKGWSFVGVGITAKGWEELVLTSTVSQGGLTTMSQAPTLTHGNGRPDSRESDSIDSNICDSLDSKIWVESDSLDSLGIAAGESGGLALIRQLTAENILLIREIDYQQRLGAALDFVRSYDWSKANRDSLVIPIQPKVTGTPKALPTPKVPTGTPVTQRQTSRKWFVKGVGLVEGTSYADAEQNCKAERGAYLAKKCGEA